MTGALLALVLLIALTACRSRDVFPKAPVVLVSIDTLRADHLPAYGYHDVETPAIDALARDSILFEDAIAQVPLTLPSHASLFTGLLPFQNGVRDNVGYRLSRQYPTIASYLRARGYATGGAVSAFVLDHSTGIAEGFDSYDDAIEAHESGEAIGEVQRPGREAERSLERWLSARPAGKPFLVFLHLYEPHTPYAPPEPFASRYAKHPYDGEIAAADAVLGKFLSFLKGKGIYDGSLVILVSDHGEGLGDHGEDEHGIFLYREAIRVPLLVKLPGSAQAGRRMSRPVALLDVFPTVCRIVGAEPPAGLAGVSLLDSSGARRVYSETLYPRFHFGWADLASLFDGRYHYVRAPRPEIYDWAEDPAEKRDLSAGFPPAFRSLRAALAGMSRPLQEPGASDPETVRKLASLGYITVRAADAGQGDLPDPKDRIGVVSNLKDATRLASQGRFDRAVRLLQDLLRKNPRMLDARETLVRVLRQAGRTGEALETLAEVDRMQPGTPQVLLGLSDLALEKGDIARARSFARAADAVGASGVGQMLAEIALNQRDFAEARHLVGKALEGNAGGRGLWLLAARIEESSGHLPAALKALDEVERMSRDQSRPLKNYQFVKGDVLARMGREREAEEAFRSEMRDFPENPRAWTGLALLYASQGKPAEAGSVLARLVAEKPAPASYFAAIRAYEVLGDSRAAAGLKAEARRLFPGAREADER
jgi:arylsulfatase A-like enzyme/tetratricopeptide (TPR) repeat protein